MLSGTTCRTALMRWPANPAYARLGSAENRMTRSSTSAVPGEKKKKKKKKGGGKKHRDAVAVARDRPPDIAETRWSGSATVRRAPRMTSGIHAALTTPRSVPASTRGGRKSGPTPRWASISGHGAPASWSSRPVVRAQRHLADGIASEREDDESGRFEPTETSACSTPVAFTCRIFTIDSCTPTGKPVRAANSSRSAGGSASTSSCPRGSNHAKAGAMTTLFSRDEKACLAHA